MAMGSREGAAAEVDFGEGNSKLPAQSCGVAAKQAKEESMKGQRAGIELYINTESIAVVGRLWLCSHFLIPRSVHN